jgi:uncharacterized protein YjiK
MLFYHPAGLPAGGASLRTGDLSVQGPRGVEAGRRPPSSLAGLGPPLAVPVAGIREASGVAWNRGRGRIFVVGDSGTLAEIEPSGLVVSTHRVKGNLEDVAVHEPSGRLVLLAEKKGELVVWDPAAASETARFELDVAGILGREPADRNQGFEGIVFRPEAGRPGGGVFHLVHQRRPARLVTLAFDPVGPGRALGPADVLARHGLKAYEDLTAVTWSDRLEKLFVIAESDDRLVAVSTDGTIEADLALPGGQQEGLAFGPDGALWVADERLGLLRFPGASSALEAALGPGAVR